MRVLAIIIFISVALAGCASTPGAVPAQPPATPSTPSPMPSVAAPAMPSGPVDAIESVGAMPSTALGQAAAAWGGAVYLFGGCHSWKNCQPNDEILKLVPGEPPVLAGHLPRVRYAAAAATVGDRIVILGGTDAGSQSQSPTLWYDPRTGHTDVKASAFVSENAAAVSDGAGSIYVFGGVTPSWPYHYEDRIQRYDVANDSFRDVSRMPRPLGGVAPAWVGGRALLFGGNNENGTFDEIWAWSPSGAASLLGHMPDARANQAVATDGTRVWLFGGDRVLADGSMADATDRILVWNGDGIQESHARLPEGVARAAAAWLDGSAYVFGGRGPQVGEAQPLALRFTPA